MASTLDNIRFPADVPSKTVLKEAQTNWLTSKDAQTKFGQLIDCLARNVKVKFWNGKTSIHIRANCQSVYALMDMIVRQLKIPGNPYSGQRFAPAQDAYKKFIDRCKEAKDLFVVSRGWEDFTPGQFQIFVQCLLEEEIDIPRKPTFETEEHISNGTHDFKNNRQFTLEETEPDVMSTDVRCSWESYASNLVRLVYPGRLPELERLETLMCRKECCWWHQYGNLEDNICCPSFFVDGRGSKEYTSALELARKGAKKICSK